MMQRRLRRCDPCLRQRRRDTAPRLARYTAALTAIVAQHPELVDYVVTRPEGREYLASLPDLSDLPEGLAALARSMAN